jgi:hypothetical protein
VNLSIINFSKRPAHKKHVIALIKWCEMNQVKLNNFIRADNVYFQTTHPYNIFCMLVAKTLRKRIFFYYHEPCFFWEKIKKGNGYRYSVLVKVVQYLEFMLSNTIIVSNSFIKRKVFKVHWRKNVLTIPLATHEGEVVSDHQKDIDILFIGRATPDQRHLDEFYRCARNLSNLKFSILTANVVPQSKSVEILGSSAPFSEKQRITALSRAKYVWTPYSSNYNQSGVIPDAFCFGCAVVVSNFETDRQVRNSSDTIVLSVKNRESWSQCLDQRLNDYDANEVVSRSKRFYRDYFSYAAYDPLISALKS